MFLNKNAANERKMNKKHKWILVEIVWIELNSIHSKLIQADLGFDVGFQKFNPHHFFD
jgi:hypothetical protein